MGVTRELARETWSEYFDALSKELLNSPVSVEADTSATPLSWSWYIRRSLTRFSSIAISPP